MPTINFNKDRKLDSLEAKKKAGVFLYRFAWVVEVFACAIGIAIAITVLFETNMEIETATGKEVSFLSPASLLSALPFFMIAVVELTKIPLATAFYFAKSIIWKLIFITSLIFVAFITFETGFNGFERNFARTNLVVDAKKRELQNLIENRTELESQVTELESLTLEAIEQRHNQRRNDLADNYLSRIENLDNLIRDTRGRGESIQLDALASQREQLRTDLKRLDEDKQRELTALYNRYDSLSSSSANDVESKRRQLNKQLEMETSNLNSLKKEYRDALDASNFFTKSAVEKKYQEMIREQLGRIDDTTKLINNLSIRGQASSLNQSLQNEVDDINRRFNDLKTQLNARQTIINKEIANISATTEKEISEQTALLRKERDVLQNEYNNQIEDNEKERRRVLASFEDKSKRANLLKEEITTLSEGILRIRNAINSKVADKQVYRMAMYVFNKDSAADLEPKSVAIVATIWFGSIAFIVAFTGIILALGSLTLRFGEDKTSGKSVYHKMLTSLRLASIAIRQKAKEPKVITKTVETQVPVEIVKEIPVEKVSIKEVPVEVIKREIVHIPLYTNDPELLGTVAPSNS